jgi:hypothetical protein
MGAYREERNIEKSLWDALRLILSGATPPYTNVSVVKSFKQASKVKLNAEEKNAIIIAKVSRTSHIGAEVGSNLTLRKPLIIIDVFGTSDGQVKDIKDLLVAELKSGFDYYEYNTLYGTISDAVYESGETANGKIIVETINDTEVNLGEDKSQADVQDRYRWRITLNCYKTLLEV